MVAESDRRIRHVAVVYNARSGALASRSGQAVEGWLSDLFRRREVSPTFRAFEPATVREDVDALLTTRPSAVMVAGGDGTVTSIAEHTAGGEVPLGVLPAGTKNCLARDLGVPLKWEAALDAVLAAPTHSIDVARVNGRPFLCNSALAMVPHLGRVRERARGATGWSLLKSWAHGVRIWQRYPRMRLEVVVDGHEHAVCTRALLVANNPLSSWPVSLPSRDRLDSGRLAVYGTRHRPPWGLLRRLRAYEGRIVEVSSSQLGLMSVMNDGEVSQLRMPLYYDIQPRHLAILAPRACP